jgi:hypothetical protein
LALGNRIYADSVVKNIVLLTSSAGATINGLTIISESGIALTIINIISCNAGQTISRAKINSIA